MALERLVTLRGFSEDDARARLAAQMSNDERARDRRSSDLERRHARRPVRVALTWPSRNWAPRDRLSRRVALSTGRGSAHRHRGPTQGVEDGLRYQTLEGITGSGKTATIAWLVERVQRPTLILEPNKSLAAQLASELRDMLPKNRVEFFVSYYDYYQPEAYVPRTDTYIEKDSSVNEEIDRLASRRDILASTHRDTIVVASVSCIYGLGLAD